MKQKNKKITIYYNSFTFFILLIGILYIYLAEEISMGFARDLVYREYFIQDNILVYLNEYFIAFLWGIAFLFTLFKSIKDKDYSFSNGVNIVTFLFLIVVTFLLIDESIMFLAVCNIFGMLRLTFLFENIFVNKEAK